MRRETSQSQPRRFISAKRAEYPWGRGLAAPPPIVPARTTVPRPENDDAGKSAWCFKLPFRWAPSSPYFFMNLCSATVETRTFQLSMWAFSLVSSAIFFWYSASTV
jgi:hypothetical protein